VSHEDTTAFAAAIEGHFGHQPDDSREKDLSAILAARLAATGSRNYGVYGRLLGVNGPEWSVLAPLLTVPETYFFRIPAHFDALVADVMPRLLLERAAVRMLRILVAGCATGEEAYTLRMVLRDRFPELHAWTVTIVATDVSELALERARVGLYSEWSLRATTPQQRAQDFEQVGKTYRLRASAREGVEFRWENLLAKTEPTEARFDLIFCRNVLIYFSERAMALAVGHLAKRLAGGGYLFLGPAESLRGMTENFVLCHSHEAFFYRLKGSNEQTSVAALGAGRRTGLNAGQEHAKPEERREDAGSWYGHIARSSRRVLKLMGRLPERIRTATPAEPGASSAPVATPSPVLQPGSFGGMQEFLTRVAEERFAEALEWLDGQSTNPELRLVRAVTLTNLGRFEEAAMECTALLQQDDVQAAAHYLFGVCREQAGALTEAEEHMARAAFLDPTFPMAHVHRGWMARRRGDDRMAEQAFRLARQALLIEDEQRLTVFGGGFSRESLRMLCENELQRLGAA